MRKKIRKRRARYAVGYGRPPASSQFRPGQSGNPNGRPKGSRNASSMARDALDLMINVKVKGTSRKMTVRKAAYQLVAEKAAAGDAKALDYLLSLESEERHRLRIDDLSGTALKHPDGWTVLNLPLIAEQDEQIPIGENLYHVRRAGDLLHPEYFSRRAVDERRSQLDEKTFAAQYQQNPLQPLGVMIKRDTIQRYDQLPIRTKSHYVIQSWDTATKVDSNNDYSACVTLLADDQGKYYLLE